MSDPVILGEKQVREVCRFGQGGKTCRFLINRGDYCCAKSTGLEVIIRRRSAGWEAQGENCSGPPHFTSLDQGLALPVIPDGYVMCKVCKRVYVCTPVDDYYNNTTNSDGMCNECLMS